MTAEKQNKLQCPACGSLNNVLLEKKEMVKAPFGPIKQIIETRYKCADCESIFIDENVTEDPYANALEQSKKESVNYILDCLHKSGYSLAAMERALELPQRTMSQWKSGRELSAAGMALLRIINTYPWIIEVAEVNYDERFSTGIIIKQAQKTLDKMAESFGYKSYVHGGICDQEKLVMFQWYNHDKEEENINMIPFPSKSANSVNSNMISIGEIGQ